MNSPKIVTTSICKIPPNLPFSKGGITPLWLSFSYRSGRQEGGGRFSNAYVNSILGLLIHDNGSVHSMFYTHKTPCPLFDLNVLP